MAKAIINGLIFIPLVIELVMLIVLKIKEKRGKTR